MWEGPRVSPVRGKFFSSIFPGQVCLLLLFVFSFWSWLAFLLGLPYPSPKYQYDALSGCLLPQKWPLTLHRAGLSRPINHKPLSTESMPIYSCWSINNRNVPGHDLPESLHTNHRRQSQADWLVIGGLPSVQAGGHMAAFTAPEQMAESVDRSPQPVQLWLQEGESPRLACKAGLSHPGALFQVPAFRFRTESKLSLTFFVPIWNLSPK